MRISDWSSDVCSSDLKDRRHYARDERIDRDTRIWRDNNGRYRCKKDNGTTGLLIGGRSEGHTSELQSLMRISYAVFCLKKKSNHNCILFLKIQLTRTSNSSMARTVIKDNIELITSFITRTQSNEY